MKRFRSSANHTSNNARIARRIIVTCARQLIGQFGYVDSDQDDLQQEFHYELLLRQDRYDPKRSAWATFVRIVVRGKALKLIEKRTAKKRDYRKVAFSLNEEVGLEDGETVERQECFDRDKYLRRTQGHSHSSVDLMDLQIDVDQVLKGLPEPLRTLCNLVRYLSITEVAFILGISRSSVYDRMAFLRKFMRDAGLEEYLRESSDESGRIPVFGK